LPALVADLRAAGLSDGDVERVTHRNWLRVLDATWG
jgi:microsomal dipeptidase-like Zn-dependent dipeptidase